MIVSQSNADNNDENMQLSDISESNSLAESVLGKDFRSVAGFMKKTSDKICILVTDDDPGIRETLSRWFRMRGFEVDTASDGVEAVEACMKKAYDAIIMDMVMPRMNGADAIREIHAIHPSMPVVVLTGYADRASEAIASGAYTVLRKPMRLQELEQKLCTLIARQKKGSSPPDDTAKPN